MLVHSKIVLETAKFTRSRKSQDKHIAEQKIDLISVILIKYLIRILECLHLN